MSIWHGDDLNTMLFNMRNYRRFLNNIMKIFVYFRREFNGDVECTIR